METLKYILAITLYIIHVKAGCQDHLINGDFEDCLCPKSEAYTSLEACNHVKALVESSPDYFNYCSDFYNPTNPVWGSQKPYSGDGYVGLILLNNDHYRIEYLTLEFKKPLDPICYQLSLKISLADCSSILVNELGFVIVEDSEDLRCKNYVITEKSHSIDLSSKDLTDKSKWNSMSTVFCADGGENELVIGTFKDGLKRLKVTYMDVEIDGCLSSSNWSYYYIDDIQLVPLDHKGEEDDKAYTHH